MFVAHVVYFFFNDTATTEIYTLSLHDALPICSASSKCTPCSDSARSVEATGSGHKRECCEAHQLACWTASIRPRDRKSTRLNSSHANISYAVFCLKKKKNKVA